MSDDPRRWVLQRHTWVRTDETTELQRLRAECCHCERCGHVQAEPNWCHECGHRTAWPPWAQCLIFPNEGGAA